MYEAKFREVLEVFVPPALNKRMTIDQWNDSIRDYKSIELKFEKTVFILIAFEWGHESEFKAAQPAASNSFSSLYETR